MRIAAFLALFFFSSCGVFGPMEMGNTYPKLNYFHQYSKVKSTARMHSNFSVLKRSVEFDWARVKEGIKIQCMITTGLNEGPLENVFIIDLDEYQIKMNFAGLEHKEYVESVQQSTTTSVASTSTITDPGGTDIVVDEKGNQKTVTRPASTKTITTQTPQTTYYDTSKTQYFNSGIVLIPNERVDLISKSMRLFFKVETKNSDILISPSRRQLQELKGLFNVNLLGIF